MQRVAVLGATGSIGTSTLDVIARNPDRLRATVLAAGRDIERLAACAAVHRPDHVVVADASRLADLRRALADAGVACEAHAGMDAIDALVTGDACDTVVAAIVGAAGLSSTLAAARAGRRIALANKESLVLAGELVMRTARAAGATVIPIDSEHSAIFQCLPGCATTAARDTSGLRRLVLTASGGPFRGRSRAAMADVTPAEAVAHPKWSMGPKISVDSATLMNKGLEVIEAHHLFGVDADRIDVVVHPQSLVHSLVEFVDGSTLAQLGLPDMRTAIATALGWPDRIDSGVGGLDLVAAGGRLDFEPPDHDAFPCLGLAFRALRAGGTAPAVLNAANEVAVEAFLAGRARFLDIPALVASALDALGSAAADDLASLEDADARARRHVAARTGHAA